MSLRDLPERLALSKHIEECKPLLEHNKDLICILEGDLLRFVEAHLDSELSPEAYKRAKPRIPPINVLKKIIDKLSRIYQKNPRRVVVDGSPADEELLSWYEEQLNVNQKWNIGNEYFNTFKNCLMQPFYDPGQAKPKLRAIPNDRFVAWTTNRVDETIPTHIALPAGTRIKKDENSRKERMAEIFWVWTADEFVVMDADGDLDRQAMAAMGNPEGLNPFGVLPFTYVNRSHNFLVPPMDTDTKRMSVLVPALLGDLNYAVKFQAFSMIVGINVDDENIAIDPSAFLSFKSDATVEGQPSVQTIKPEVDIDQVIRLIGAELSMWLNSRGIRPGTIGTATPEGMASGISKIVDESDISEERERQVEFFQQAEQEFWGTLLKRMHPIWVSQGLVENRTMFSENAKVEVEFAEQLPLGCPSPSISSSRPSPASSLPDP